MVDLKTHEKLMQQWRKDDPTGRIYATPKRIRPRLDHLEGLLPMVVGMDVVEIGANAGLHAIEICALAHSYVGVEPDATYWRQFETTMSMTERAYPRCSWGLYLDLAHVHPDDLDSADVLVCCVALYLLSPEELRMLQQCNFDRVIIQERVANRSKPGNRTNGLHTPGAIAAWVEKLGLRPHCYWHSSRKFFEIVGC